jgi:hypothetical protein
VVAGNSPKGQPLPNTSNTGIPPELTFWLAADKEVKSTFDFFSQIQKERKSIRDMLDTVVLIEKELQKLESEGVSIYDDSLRTIFQLRNEAAGIDSQIDGASSNISSLIQKHKAAQNKLAKQMEESGSEQTIPEDPEIGELDALLDKLPGKRSAVVQGRGVLKALERKIAQLKIQTLAKYKQDYRTLSQPIRIYASQVEELYAQASDMTATAARQGLVRIEGKLYDYILQAQTGVVDTSWRATEGSADEVKKMQRRMQEEIRKFRYQMRQSSSTDDPSTGSK